MLTAHLDNYLLSLAISAPFVYGIVAISLGILASMEIGAYPTAGFQPVVMAFAISLLGGSVFGTRYFFCFPLSLMDESGFQLLFTNTESCIKGLKQSLASSMN
uniref:Uncharacterized protein n=1 Tax=Candidatus Kentrum sp. MB TaxID=2138164 RepID=A0A450XGR7_9GAMM|nr:MAG: hypothetical protein BECKMB1821G_GA0114241_100456 [Candidatus Kentron sp. MB]VFK28434.1 MAG: hypothetical protein BECKMB1821I_GA0114274_100654 [Candidatus Kentron sp. MB]VFK74251.1 MAG: hypothetical protein BECKMB1821H_GA0114242_100272 [Candidatus Kentron sp. MB]